MSRKKKPLPLLSHIRIEDIAAEGKAIARVDGLVVFAPYVVPGDVCDLQLRRKKHSYAEAEAVQIHTYSEERDEPFCPHFGTCGGCKWQCLRYDRQLHYKQQQVEAALTRIAKVALPPIQPILGSEQIRGYRNKLEFGFSNRKWLTREVIERGEAVADHNAVGFHIAGAFDKILDITHCGLMPEINNTLRNAIRDYAAQHALSYYDIREGKGLLRNMMLRSSETGELMLLMQFAWRTDEEQAEAFKLLEYLHTQFPAITSLLYVNNLKCNDTIGDLPVFTYAGTDFIYEVMEDLRFKVGPKSFYQTNTKQAYELYKVARRMAALTGEEVVYDLYTGTGTIAQFVARGAKRVVGIEYVPEAIEDAKENARLNAIDNAVFFAGDMKDILTPEFIAEQGRPDVIITDPPRAGMHADVVQTILQAAPQRIVYVSCNPATQARDLALLDAAYQVVEVQPVDMFPHTHHVENVCLLQAR
ncbi:MAG: 23S rRNA (uracil(1939)-C(5))-methyltransferase RlmD [Bacteroidaceae bacterium]|nr:23S rRNA (uracil(1939)-C(5))-methyltransferase RlmD [Bacteroidaceae bacterium]